MPSQTLALPFEFSKYILFFSYLSACSALLAVYKRLYDLAVVPALVLFTSVNYWRLPDYSSRRYVDIVAVQVGIFYQSFRAQGAPEPYRTIFFKILFLACICFAPAMYFVQRPHDGNWQNFMQKSSKIRRNLALSTFCHVLCHIFGNVSNFVLYTSGVEHM